MYKLLKRLDEIFHFSAIAEREDTIVKQHLVAATTTHPANENSALII